MSGRLYVVATPIGNLEDISERAIATLASVDAILAEDTRVTSKLLARLKIQKTLIAYHEHSDEKRTGEIINRLKSGESLALVTDAGTPGISDPGGKLVEVISQQLPEVVISPIPGPSALIAALSICGFPTNDFVFLGFPPHKKGRNKYFDRITSLESTIVFYESTHRIMKAMEQLERVCPDRDLVVCRELTKIYESIYRGSAREVTVKLEADSIKGEFVIVVGPKK